MAKLRNWGKRMRLFHALVLTVALLAQPALAAPEDVVMNKEGYWGIDIDNGACAASMTLQGGSIFLLRALDGEVTFGLFGVKSPIRKGKTGRIETDAGGFDFAASYGEDAMTLFYAETFDAKALEVLRPARQLRILIDGAPVTTMTLEGTGFEGALDGVMACSKGQSGWWGKGASAADAAGAKPELVYHPDGVWTIVVSEDVCIATAAAPDDRFLQLLAFAGNTALAVGSNAGPLPRGGEVRVETDGYAFNFKPDYDEDAKYLTSDDPLESADLFALRRAKSVRMRVGRRELLNVQLEGDTFFEVVENVAACARGEKGWWGEGAKPAR